MDNIRDEGFDVSKDFILKTFLFLYRIQSNQFPASNAHAFEEKWDDIRDAIWSVFKLAKSFGFTNSTLVSKNVLIPIVYHRGIADGFTTKKKYEKDRKAIKKWLHTMLVKRIFGASADTVLNQIRRFTTNVSKKVFSNDAIDAFPAADVNKSISAMSASPTNLLKNHPKR